MTKFTTKKLRLAFIGTGRVAQHYGFIFKKFNLLKSIAVSGVYDINLDKASNYAKLYSFNHFDNLNDINYKNTDCVVILTPSGMHEENASFFLKKKINVLVEKPIGLNPNKVLKNIAFANRNGLSYGSIFQNRLNPAIQFTKTLIDENELGKITSISVKLQWCRHQAYYEDDWHGTWAFDGGVISQQAIHHIDILQWLFGFPLDLSAFKFNSLNKLEAEDTLVASGRLLSGSLFTIEATTASRPRDLQATLSILGENGFIEISGIALNKISKLYLVNDSKKYMLAKKNYSEYVKNGYGFSHSRALVNMAKLYSSDGIVRMPVAAIDSLNALYFVHNLYYATETNNVINFNITHRSKFLGINYE